MRSLEQQMQSLAEIYLVNIKGLSSAIYNGTSARHSAQITATANFLSAAKGEDVGQAYANFEHAPGDD